MVADVLKRWCTSEWRYTHLPMGEKRSAVTAARLKRMGVTRGWPDFQFFHSTGMVCFLELKRDGSKLTREQRELSKFMSSAGHRYLVASDFDEVLIALGEWGVVPLTIHQARGQKPCSANVLEGDAIE